MEIMEIFKNAVEKRASDIFIVPGAHITFKLDGVLTPIEEKTLTSKDTEEHIRNIYSYSNRDIGEQLANGDDDFSFAVPGLSRFRINVYRQRGSLACVIRVIAFSIPNYKELNIPEEIMSLSSLTSGMIIFTGTAGCGKSTTQACLIDRINLERACHIITLEDPLEYLHRNNKSIISQREVGVDTKDYLSALRACLRQSPDVILLGEMRDSETIHTAITAAETGHLVITTLHTNGAVNAIDRIIDSFPPEQQNQIRTQLGTVLNTVISQKLLIDTNGKQIPAFEIMHTTPAIAAMIRENKSHQINNVIASGRSEGMILMDRYISDLYKDKKIDLDTALNAADNREGMERSLKN